MARLAVIGLAAALVLGFAGCSDEPGQGPTGAEIEAERARLAAQMKKGAKKKKRSSLASAPSDSQVKESGFAAVEDDYTYIAAGRRDPFEPYRIVTIETQGERGGPLEQFELQQLGIVALIWDARRPRAIVSDPAGSTYVVRVGSRMGKNEGKVIHIGDNLVLVKETYVDYAGEQSTKDVELRIRRSQGG